MDQTLTEQQNAIYDIIEGIDNCQSMSHRELMKFVTAKSGGLYNPELVANVVDIFRNQKPSVSQKDSKVFITEYDDRVYMTAVNGNTDTLQISISGSGTYQNLKKLFEHLGIQCGFSDCTTKHK